MVRLKFSQRRQISFIHKMWNLFNSTYARLAPKRVGWNKIKGRIASGVISQNDPIHVPFVIMNCCKVELELNLNYVYEL